ncbi:mycofactocin biosynthesis peptidyl-dipeptidase MftE [Actinomycetospora termitidis]|uniref:Mycofactocin biosynthesis peptidyl-dipeptidase MftE n=1 Tax=Actinomycetospora termitidis TaxID=3053470 RepID=A0ABT7MA27_9PSEU|nr:mycofactocin biosynthesis peptidyl-dipeptidase MftE [Actinomycetospora sp. Odt1-22]MDL5157510.1 mycofactocin biosynthesis peptidyl-dipeptidase MftE [Actinomycetospora sp. Odt1-22]
MEISNARSAECAGTDLLLVPVGATEQHGPHLPLGTDTTVATTVAARLGLPVTAPIAFGASGEHEGFDGTISIGTETLAAVLVETGRSACRWARRLCFVNGHGGNVPALATATTLLRYEGRDVAWHSCGVPGADAHAGRYETSLMLALAPDHVRADLAAPGNTAPLAELMPAMRAGSVRDVSPNGVLGDPTGASAAEGAETVAVLAAALRDAIADWRVSEHGRLS